MALGIQKFITNASSEYNTLAFQKVLEDHMPILIKSTNVKVLSPDGAKRFAHYGNLYGLLRDLGINSNYHWSIMRANGLTSPHDVVDPHNNIIVPSFKEIDALLSRYKTGSSIL